HPAPRADRLRRAGAHHGSPDGDPPLPAERETIMGDVICINCKEPLHPGARRCLNCGGKP
ncbi:hypothetical protein, partial [Streptomyces smyrnaeus]|uniref:hypothetical protein n=1 Tax=Streptomyces smyrnaeus TaxID=1387713 RepID=UPI0036AEA077